MGEAHRNASCMKIILTLRDGVFPIVKDGSGQRGTGPTGSQTFVNMLQIANPAGGNHRDLDPIGNRPGQLQIVAFLGAVPVHAGKKNLPRAVGRHLFRPLAGIDPGRFSSAVSKNLPPSASSLGINSNHDTLAAEVLRRLADKLRPGHGPGIDGDLIRAGPEKLADIFDFGDAPADRQRHENFVRRARHNVQDNLPDFMRSGDIQEAELVRAFPIVDAGDLYRVTGIAETDKPYSFHYPSRVHIETWDNALGKHKTFVDYPTKISSSSSEKTDPPRLNVGQIFFLTCLPI